MSRGTHTHSKVSFNHFHIQWCLLNSYNHISVFSLHGDDIPRSEIFFAFNSDDTVRINYISIEISPKSKSTRTDFFQVPKRVSLKSGFSPSEDVNSSIYSSQNKVEQFDNILSAGHTPHVTRNTEQLKSTSRSSPLPPGGSRTGSAWQRGTPGPSRSGPTEILISDRHHHQPYLGLLLILVGGTEQQLCVCLGLLVSTISCQVGLDTSRHHLQIISGLLQQLLCPLLNTCWLLQAKHFLLAEVSWNFRNFFSISFPVFLKWILFLSFKVSTVILLLEDILFFNFSLLLT